MKIITQPLNPSQLEAANSPINGPLLIVAGAGSGKTTALTARLKSLLARGVDPSKIIAITFTNKAANEMKTRVFNSTDINPAASTRLFVGTFHSFGARLLKKEAKLLGRNNSFSIYDNSDSRRLIRQALKDLNVKSLKDRTGPAAVSSRISWLKNNLEDVTPLASSSDPYDRLIANVYTEYENRLEANNAFDFDDLIVKPVILFRSRPDLLNRYQTYFPYILVDEYQDVNSAQYTFIKLLAGTSQNLTVVGDDNQAIYKFRGADYRNFLNFDQDFKSAHVVTLEENYRSTQNIVSASSGLIAHNLHQRPKNLFTKNDVGAPIKIIEHDNESAEASWIIHELKANPDPTTILYRTNAQSRPLEQSLIEAGLSYDIYGGLKFYERKEIKDLVASLRYALNPDDSLSLERLHKNFYKRHFDILQAELPVRAKSLPPADLLRFVINSTDYVDNLGRKFTNAGERAENIEELISFAGQFKDLLTLSEKISLFESADSGPRRRSKTNYGTLLMTIHLAKGLEFDRVFVAGCSDGLIPHERSFKTKEDIEEERRLMYVAMTRAKKELTLSFYDIPSRFLSEIPEEYLTFNLNSSLDLDDEERYISI